MSKAIKGHEVKAKVTTEKKAKETIEKRANGPFEKKASKSHSNKASKVASKVAENHNVPIKPKASAATTSKVITEPATGENRPPVEIAKAIFSMRNFHADRDLPIVYCPNYNMSAAGIELTADFDTKKYGKIAEFLNGDFMDTPWARLRHFDEPVGSEQNDDTKAQTKRMRFLAPNRPVTRKELEAHHTSEYVTQIHETRSVVARITEIWALNLLPLLVLENRLLTPIKWQLAGSIFAFNLAMQHGWSINIGGGFHQASASEGETFCIFSDIMLAMKYIWRKHPLQKFMIIDLDAHQATGVERDLLAMNERQRSKVYMVDIFNTTIQPPNERAASAINLKVELGRFTGDKTYLNYLEQTLTSAFAEFKPTMLVYVAGQDILKDDQLGLLNITSDALMKRDEMVFTWATQNSKCPIVMLLGGGYLARGARIQADSIKNLYSKNLIWGGHRSGSRSLSRPKATNLPTKGSVSGSVGAKKV